MDHHALRLLLFLIFASFSPFSSGSCGALAARNVTIGDRDLTITYTPQESWGVSSEAFCLYGTCTWATAPNAIATFNFTGTAIYILSPDAIPNHGEVSLDSAPPISLDQVYPSGLAPAQQGILWYATGLENKPHMLQILASGDVHPFAIVDALRYTDISDTLSSATSIPPPTSLVSSSATPTQTNRVVASSTSAKKHATAIALGTIFGILGLSTILFALWHFWRKREWRRIVGTNNSSRGNWVTRSRAVGRSEGGGFSKVLGALGLAPTSTEQGLLHDGRSSSPAQSGYGLQMRQTPEGERAIPRYGLVDPPLPPIPPPTHGLRSPQTPAQGYAYRDENGYYHSNHPRPYSYQPPPPIIIPNTPAANQRTASITPSTTTEGQTPQMPGSGGPRDEAFVPNFT